MRRGEHDILSDHSAGAEAAARADDRDHRARDVVGRRAAAADDGRGGGGDGEREHNNQALNHRSM
jgi:hypothetical protein